VIIDLRVMKFIDKTARTDNAVLNVLYQSFGKNEMRMVQERHGITPGSVKSWRFCTWDCFAEDVKL